jgi:hypothetical protein
MLTELLQRLHARALRAARLWRPWPWLVRLPSTSSSLLVHVVTRLCLQASCIAAVEAQGLYGSGDVTPLFKSVNPAMLAMSSLAALRLMQQSLYACVSGDWPHEGAFCGHCSLR